MSEKPISPLRQRMIEDMIVRNFVEKTRNDYIRQVKTFRVSSCAVECRQVHGQEAWAAKPRMVHFSA